MIKKAIIDAVAFLMITIFTYTAIMKFTDLQKFHGGLSHAPFISSVAWPIAILVPALEVFISALLFFPKSRVKGLWGSLALMVAFTGYLGYIITYQPHSLCSCGGIIEVLNWNQHVIFNSTLIILIIASLLLGRSLTKQAGTKPRPAYL